MLRFSLVRFSTIDQPFDVTIRYHEHYIIITPSLVCLRSGSDHRGFVWSGMMWRDKFLYE